MNTMTKMPSGKYTARENLKWKLISDAEYVELYGTDSLKQNEFEEMALISGLTVNELQKKRCCKKKDENKLKE